LSTTAYFGLKATVVHYKPLPSRASIKAIGLSIYWDAHCTDEATSVDWGVIESNTKVTRTIYILAVGNSPLTLSMYTEAWQPPNAVDFITLTWNVEGQTIQPQQIIPAELTLFCQPNVTGITDFSFNIVIVGVG